MKKFKFIAGIGLPIACIIDFTCTSAYGIDFPWYIVVIKLIAGMMLALALYDIAGKIYN